MKPIFSYLFIIKNKTDLSKNDLKKKASVFVKKMYIIL